VFVTALPFGYLIQFVVLVGGAVIVGALLLRGLRGGDRRALRVGAGITVGLLAVLMLSALQPSIDEMNPYPIADGALLGRWVDGSRSLELRADSTYVLRSGTRLIASGRFHLFDWNLRFAGASGAEEAWRVVIAGGEYRITPDLEDFDVWDGNLGFRRAPPARPPST
jgi:hypothetical protein